MPFLPGRSLIILQKDWHEICAITKDKSYGDDGWTFYREYRGISSERLSNRQEGGWTPVITNLRKIGALVEEARR
jgi:hypothetical protein